MKTLEKIIKKITKKIAIGTVCAAALTGATVHYFTRDEPNPLVWPSLRKVISAEYNTRVTVIDKKGRKHEFSRFSMSPSCVGEFPVCNMAVTMQDDSGLYHLFWLGCIKSIENHDADTTIYFKDGTKFHGEWVGNETTHDFYPEPFSDKPPTHTPIAKALSEDGKASCIHLAYSRSINIDTTNSESGFEKEFKSQFKEDFPKIVELIDGRRYFTRVGYIVDCGGLWHFNVREERLEKYCELRKPDWKHIPLKDISEIELTGEFDEEYPQCRKVIIRYRDNKVEEGSLRLVSESYNGAWRHSKCYREWDKFILHNEKGALIVPLDYVRKIMIPHIEDKIEAKQNVCP